MGLLDDLQKEVDTKRAEEQRQTAELEAQEEFYESQLKPVMVRAFHYWQEVIENLNIVERDVRPAYPLDPSIRNGITLVQGDYRLDYDNRKSPRQINICCTCTLDQPHQFHLPTKDAVLKHSDFLDSYEFAYHRRERRDKRHNIRSAFFFLEGPMPVHIQILADAKERCISVHLRNLENQPIKRYTFSPERFDDALLERLALLLIREESALVEVAISDDARNELRTRVELDKRRNEEDLADALRHLAIEKERTENAKLINRLRRTVALKAGKILQI